MNFADILEQWENRPEASSTLVDLDERADHMEEETLHAPAARYLEVEDEIDLHGLRVDEATRNLHRFLTSASTRRLRKVLVIHGKGIHSNDGRPVLRDEIRSFLEEHPLAGQMGVPGREQGGAGATWVLVRQRVRQRSR